MIGISNKLKRLREWNSLQFPFVVEFITAFHRWALRRWKTRTTLSTPMKYSRNLFPFSNGIRAINYSRFIIVANGWKIPFQVFLEFPTLVELFMPLSLTERGRFQYILHSQHVRVCIESFDAEGLLSNDIYLYLKCNCKDSIECASKSIHL